MSETNSIEFDPKPQAVPEGPFEPLDPEKRPADQWIINESKDDFGVVDLDVLELLQAQDQLYQQRANDAVEEDAFKEANRWINNSIEQIRKIKLD